MCAASSAGEKSAALSYSNSEALLTTQPTGPSASIARASRRAHRGFVGQVALQQRGAPAQRAHAVGGLARLGLRAAVVHGHVPAGLRQPERDRAPDAPAGAGDQRNLRAAVVTVSDSCCINC